MAEHKLLGTMEALFKGMDSFLSTKTVVGEPIQAGEAVIIPLIDVSCGMGAGSFANSTKQNSGGGMSARMSPVAILIVQNGITKLVNVKNQDILAKIIDMIPEIINKFSAKDKISDRVESLAKDLASKDESGIDTIEI